MTPSTGSDPVDPGLAMPRMRGHKPDEPKLTELPAHDQVEPPAAPSTS
jgi:hypothetical protein